MLAVDERITIGSAVGVPIRVTSSTHLGSPSVRGQSAAGLSLSLAIRNQGNQITSPQSPLAPAPCLRHATCTVSCGVRSELVYQSISRRVSTTGVRGCWFAATRQAEPPSTLQGRPRNVEKGQGGRESKSKKRETTSSFESMQSNVSRGLGSRSCGSVRRRASIDAYSGGGTRSRWTQVGRVLGTNRVISGSTS